MIMIRLVKKLLLWFYCIDIPDAVLLLSAATGIFLTAHRRLGEKRWWRWLTGLALLSWMLLIVCTTILDRKDFGTAVCSILPFHSYREAISNENREILRSNFMNVALFYPAGLLGASVLPNKWPSWTRWVILAVLAAASVGVESAQYCFALGRCEVDDIIHNTLGAFLGWLAFLKAANFLRPESAPNA